MTIQPQRFKPASEDAAACSWESEEGFRIGPESNYKGCLLDQSEEIACVLKTEPPFNIEKKKLKEDDICKGLGMYEEYQFHNPQL